MKKGDTPFINEYSVMFPTNKLRWININNVVPDINITGPDPISMPTLQQYWEDSQGNGEWRDVPTETE